MHYSFLLVLLCCSASSWSKLNINKCLLSNGTISYQEKSCADGSNKAIVNENKSSTKNNKPKLAKKKLFKQHRVISRDRSYNIKPNSNQLKLISEKVGGVNISMQAMQHWDVNSKVYNKKLYHTKFFDRRRNSELFLMIDFIFPDNKKFSNNELQDLIYLIGSRYIKGSKEQQLNIYGLDIENGYGLMTTFTHSDEVKDFVYATKGVMFMHNWLIQFTLLSNNISSSNHKFALQMLSNGISIK
jgi:hypothetical protein